MTNTPPISCLFVAYAYPPISAPGAVRITRTLKHLDRLQVEPLVLTVSGGHSVREGGLADPLANEENRVFRVRDPLGAAAAKARTVEGSTETRLSLGKHVRRLVNRIASAVLLPDRKLLWALRCFRMSKTLQSRGISVVYSSSPSASNHIVGYFLAKKLGAVWIAEFRDPLSWLTEGAEISWLRRQVMSWIESWAVKHAHSVPVVSEPFAEYFRSRYPDSEVVSIPNGADIDGDVLNEVLSTRERMTDQKTLTLVHAGSLYDGDRDPSPLIAATKRAREKYGLDVQVKFAGNDTHIAMKSAQELGARDFVFDLGNLVIEDAERTLREASANVVILNSDQIGKIGLMSKFFDYIAAGAPIMVFGPKDSNLSQIVEEDGAGRAFDLSEIDAAADYIYRLKDAPAPDTRAICEKWSAQRMAQRIQETIVTQAHKKSRF